MKKLILFYLGFLVFFAFSLACAVGSEKYSPPKANVCNVVNDEVAYPANYTFATNASINFIEKAYEKFYCVKNVRYKKHETCKIFKILVSNHYRFGGFVPNKYVLTNAISYNKITHKNYTLITKNRQLIKYSMANWC